MAKVASGETMRSAVRLLQVLKCFGAGSEELSAADISRDLGLAPSTVRRLLLTLEQEGFLQQQTAGGGYGLHTEVIRLAAAALAGSSLVKLAGPVLDALSRFLNEAVQLSLRREAEVVILDNRQSRHLVKTFHGIGHQYPAYRGSAAGKVLLAWLSEEDVTRLLPAVGTWAPNTERSITDLPGFRVALAETRARGYGINDGETEPGVWSVAAPLRDHRGEVLAAINVPCPVSRLTGDRPRRHHRRRHRRGGGDLRPAALRRLRRSRGGQVAGGGLGPKDRPGETPQEKHQV